MGQDVAPEKKKGHGTQLFSCSIQRLREERVVCFISPGLGLGNHRTFKDTGPLSDLRLDQIIEKRLIIKGAEMDIRDEYKLRGRPHSRFRGVAPTSGSQEG